LSSTVLEVLLKTDEWLQHLWYRTFCRMASLLRTCGPSTTSAKHRSAYFTVSSRTFVTYTRFPASSCFLRQNMAVGTSSFVWSSKPSFELIQRVAGSNGHSA
jgi:hypothetical protein